jgi:hypothetical protein
MPTAAPSIHTQDPFIPEIGDAYSSCAYFQQVRKRFLQDKKNPHQIWQSRARQCSCRPKNHQSSHARVISTGGKIRGSDAYFIGFEETRSHPPTCGGSGGLVLIISMDILTAACLHLLYMSLCGRLTSDIYVPTIWQAFI